MADANPIPQDTKAEQATLGSMLIEQEAAERGLAIVGPEDFYREAHQLICQAMCAVADRGEPVDLVTVSTQLIRDGHLELAGGGEYLTALVNLVPTAAHITRYATIVAEKSMARATIKLAADIQAAATADPEDPGKLVAQAAESFQELYQARVRMGALPAAEHSRRAWEDFEALFATDTAPCSVRTGIRDFDRRTGGLDAQRLVIVMGDSKHGKSSLARQIAIETARQFRRQQSTKRVLFIALEEDEKMTRAKFLSYIGGINSKALQIPGQWLEYYPNDDNVADRYSMAQEELEGLPLDLDFEKDDCDQCVAAITQWAHENDPGLVVVDYFQLLTDDRKYPTDASGFRARAQRLRKLSNKLGVPLVTPSQVTYNESLKTWFPYGSKDIVREASLVMRIHRERDRETHELLDVCHLFCEYSRITDTFGRVPLKSYMQYGRFLGLDDAAALEQQEQEVRWHDN